jgi:hypothetical protein
MSIHAGSGKRRSPARSESGRAGAGKRVADGLSALPAEERPHSEPPPTRTPRHPAFRSGRVGGWPLRALRRVVVVSSPVSAFAS